MDHKRSLKWTIAGILAVVAVAGTQPANVGGISKFAPIMASAADEVTADQLKINDKAYTVTDGALSADAIAEIGAEDDLTIQLQADVEIKDLGTLLDLSKHQNIKVEFNGFTLTTEKRFNFYNTVPEGQEPCTRTITFSGSKKATSKLVSEISGNAMMGLYDTNGSTYDKLVVNFEQSINVDVPKSYAVLVNCQNGHKARDITVNIGGSSSATIKSKFGLYVNGTVNVVPDEAAGESPATFNIMNSAKIQDVDNTQSVIYQAGYSLFRISGGTLTGGSAVYSKQGLLEITGGTLTAKGEAAAYTPNGDGSNTTGDAIVVEDNDRYLVRPKVTISGGTISSANAKAIAAYKAVNLVESSEEPDVSIAVTGGTFKEQGQPADVSAYYADNGITYITDDNGKIYNASEVVIEATSANGVKTYLTSITGPSSNTTYKLLKDVTATRRIAPGILVSDFTIDLNGHTLTSNASDSAFLLTRGGTATSHKTFKIINSADEEGTVITNVTDASHCAISTSGTYNDVTIGENVKFKGDVGMLGNNQTLDVYGTISSDGSFAVATNGSSTDNSKINIHDGAYLESETVAIYQPAQNTELNIEGGTITAQTAVYVKSGSVQISGGTLHATGAQEDYQFYGSGCYSTGDALVLEASSSGYHAAPTATITGGSFISDHAQSIGVYRYEQSPFDKPEPVITGGAFSDQDPASFAPVGYKAELDSETGLYQLVEDTEIYIVSFGKNGGSGKMSNIKGRYNETVTLPDCGFTAPAEKKFVGWEIDGEIYQPGDELSLTEDISVSAVWEDAKLRQSIEFDDSKIEKIFGDADFAFSPIGAQTEVTYESSDPAVAAVAADGTVTIVGAGEAVITATAAETDEYFSASAKYKLVVDKAQITVSAALSDWAYGAEPNTVVITGNSGNAEPVIEYKAADADDSAYSQTVPTTAGQYAVKVTIPETANYYGGTAETTFAIQRALPNAVVTPADALVYTGEPQALFTSASSEDGTVMFSTDNGDTWSDVIPTGTDAGIYTVLYKVDGEDTNFEDTEPAELHISIAQAVNSWTSEPAAIADLVYQAAAQDLVTGGIAAGGTVLYKLGEDGEYTETIPAVSDAGTYTVYYKVTGNQNYSDIPEQSFTIQVAAKTVTPVLNETSFVYDGTEKLPVVSLEGILDGDVCAFTDNCTAQTNVGTYTVTVSDLTNPNYQLAAADLSFEITSADAACTVTGADGLIYNGSDQTLAAAESVSGGTVVYSLDGENWSETAPAAANAGTYTVYYKVIGDANHNDTEADTVTVNIARKEVSIVWDETSFIYSGNDCCPTAALEGVAEGDDCTITGISGAASEAGTYEAAVTGLSGEDAENYKLPDIVSTSFTIEKAEADYTVTANQDLVYNGTAQALVTFTSPDGCRIMYSLTEDGIFTDSLPEGLNAGDYIVYYYLDGGNDFESTDIASVQVNIAQKEVQLTWNPSEFTYDGAVHQPEAIPEGVLEGDDVIVNISGGAADAGNYTAEAALGGSLADNYVLTGETEYAFTIQQAASSISLAVAEDLVYNGTAQALVDYVEFEGGTLLFSLDGENWSEDQPTALHAGTYTVYYKVDGGNNYTGTETTSFDIEIAQAVVGIEWGQTDFVYNGSEQAPTAAVTGLFGDDTCTATVTGAETNAGTYTAVASDLSNTDYVLSNDTGVAFTIEQKTVDFTWDETQLVYTGEEIAPNVILNGVLDGDDCAAIVNGAQTEPGTYIAQVTGLNNSNYKLGNGTSQTAFSIYKEEYVVIFDANGGSGSKIKTKIGGAYTLKTFEEYGFAAPEHQKFAGWDVEGTVYQAGDEIVISDVTLIKALWDDAKQYQTAIAFDDNKIEKTFGDDTFTNELTGAETAVSYSSSDPSVATVDENGIVTIVGAGSAVITADAEEDDAFFAASASYRVLVAKAAITPSVSITGWTEGETANAPVVTGNDGSGDVTFAYKVSGADDDTYSDAVPETAGTYTVKAIIAESANYQGGSAETDFTIAEAAPQIQAELISSNTVSFKENIMLNFYADIDAEHAEGAYVIFSYSHYGEPKEVRVELNPNQTLRSGGKTYYVFGCPLSVAELAIDVSAKLYLADSDDAVSEQVSSVTAYCERMLERSSTNEVTKNALKALLNFGGYTQIALNLNTDKLANENYQSDVSDITAEVSGEFVKPTEKIGGVQYAGMQLVMRDAVVARYVFHVDSLEGVKFFVNGVEVTPKKSNNLYYIDAEPVKAMNLTRVNEIVVQTADGDISFKHSAMDYADGQINGNNEAMANAMKAMCDYYSKVKAYVESGN